MKLLSKILTAFILLSSLFLNHSHSQVATISVLNPVCNNNGTLVVTVNGGTTGNFYSYTWHTNSGTVMQFGFDITDTLYNFSGGPVYIFIEQNSAPLGYITDTISFPFNLQYTVLPDSCPLQTGAIILNISGTVPPVTFNWTYGGIPFGGNTSSITNLSGGEYDCLITDGTGCQMYLSDLLSDSALTYASGIIVPSITNMTLTTTTTPANCNNGTATVIASGGVAPYTYLWSNSQTTATATGIYAATIMNVTVTDANGCISYSGAFIFNPTNMISTNHSVTPANCSYNDGAIATNPTGGTAPYSFLWNTFATSQNISNLPAGNYTVTITDATGCFGIANIQVMGITPVIVSTSTTPSICNGSTGTATGNAFNGTGPYTYEWFTTPVQNTSTATGLSAGPYNFKVTDSQGCIRTGTVNIQQNTTLGMSLGTTPSICNQNNGSVMMNVFGGNSPYTYLWSSGQTTTSVSGLSQGNYFGTVTDASGCTISRCINVGSTTQLYYITNAQPASCLYTADGVITVNIITGSPPYTYQWSNGMTTSSISGLLPGNYYLTVTDANGCSLGENIFVGFTSVNPCTSEIRGKVYIDLNQNCSLDFNEPVMENIPIRCITTGEIDFTDVNGNYSFYHPAGAAEIEQLPMPYRYQSCPSTNPFTINIPSTGMVITQDIGDTVDWVTDLTVDMWNYSSPPVVGFSYVKKVVEFNRGTIAVASTNQYDYDVQAPYAGSSLPPTTFNPVIRRATWSNGLFVPLRTRAYNVTHSIPATIPINTALYYNDTIFPVAGDTTWWDNSVFKIDYTVGPYDPNYKEVSPRGVGAQGFISLSDSILEYVIHFQNLGNYYAENVRITDQLSNYLEPSTLRVKYATDEVVTSISASGVVEFKFDDILLPPLQYDSIGSNGFVVYTIHLKPNLADGTQITNSADIYFDFNAPIVTNTTLNTILITGTEDLSTENEIMVFPNPSANGFHFKTKSVIGSNVNIYIHDISGRRIPATITKTGASEFYLEQLPSGVYFAEVWFGDKKEVVKIVQMR